MSKRLYVGNLDFNVTDDQLKKFFEGVGKVDSAEVVVKPMGFGFVEMNSEEDAKAAIEALNGQQLLDRQVKVDFAKERNAEPAPAKAEAPAPDASEETVEVPVEQPAASEKK